MALKFPCPQCGTPNRYEEQECGTDKYCISCQRLITVPAAGAEALASASEASVRTAPTPPATPSAVNVAAAAPLKLYAAPPAPGVPRVPHTSAAAVADGAVDEKAPPGTRVFGVLDTDTLVQGTVLCPCDPDKPVEIPYRISDIAVGQVYCPRCSRAVSIGESLDRARELSGAAPPVEVAAPQLRPRSWRRSAPGVIGMITVAAALVAGIVWMWRDAPAVARVLVSLGLGEDPLIKSGVPAKAVIIPLTEADMARLGLVMAAGPMAIGPSGPVPAALAVHPGLLKKTPPAPEFFITLETIQALLKEPDAQAALITAQVWKQVLADQRVPAADERHAALERVIREIEQRLHPASDPSVIARFRELLNEIRAALSEAQEKEARLADAAKSLAQAEALLEKHPQDLAVLGRVYYDLKRGYGQIEREKNGLRRIDAHLDQAEALAAKEAGTRALEHEAKAKFLARRTPAASDKKVGERLEERVRKLTPELQFARGKQAVMELRQCLVEGDQATRDRLVLEARTHLPHLPSSKVGALMQEVEKSASAATPGGGSAFIRRVAFRVLYEKALESYAVADGPKLLAHAAGAAKLAAGEDERKLAALVFEFLDEVASDTLPLPDRAPELAERFGALRALLDQAGPWQHDARWRKLDEPLRKRGEQAAQAALAQARRLSKDGQLAEARRDLKNAMLLGETPTKKTAEDLDKSWEQEAKDRAERATLEQHWQVVLKFHAQKKVLETWSELNRFSQRYPKSAHQEKSKTLDGELRPQVAAFLTAKFREMDGYRDKQLWHEFQQGYELLRPLPLTGAEAARLDKYRAQIESNQREAGGRFFQLADRNRAMTNPQQVINLLKGLPPIVAIAPDLAEAGTLLEQAREKGRLYAKEQLRWVGLLAPVNPKAAQDRLREIEILDSGGPTAVAARELLKQKSGQ